MNPHATSQPCVVVHGVEHARAVLAHRRPATLLSAPGAALFAGPGWWREVMAAARESSGGTPFADVLDCADASGLALAALGLGQRWLVLLASCGAFPVLARIAAEAGGGVLPCRPAALDLAAAGAAARLAGWLDGAGGAGRAPPG